MHAGKPGEPAPDPPCAQGTDRTLDPEGLEHEMEAGLSGAPGDPQTCGHLVHKKEAMALLGKVPALLQCLLSRRRAPTREEMRLAASSPLPHGDPGGDFLCIRLAVHSSCLEPHRSSPCWV